MSQPDTVEIVSAPACKHCSSQNLIREGFYRSRVLEEQGERRQIVRCGDCNRFTYLAVGVVLPLKHQASVERLRRQIAVRTAVYEETKDVTDVRPNCPRCGGNKIQRHRKLDSGKRCWECRDCRRSFVAEDSAEHIDHRRVSHFHEADPREEALFLFHFAQRHDNVARVRKDICISSHEKNDLEFLVGDGVLLRAEIDDAIWFRAQVLQVFDELVHKQRKCSEVLRTAGMLASGLAEATLKSRDEMMRPFDNLIDAELAVMTPELEPKRLREDSQPAMTGRENPDSVVVIEAGEEAMSPSPVFLAAKEN